MQYRKLRSFRRADATAIDCCIYSEPLLGKQFADAGPNNIPNSVHVDSESGGCA